MRAAARQAPQTGVPENTRQVAQLISLSRDTKEITKNLGVTLYFRGRGNKESTHLTFSISTPQRLVIKRKLEIPQREKKMVSTRPNPRSHYESLKPPGGFGPNPPLHEVRV